MSRVFERCLLFSFQKVAIVTVSDFGISKVLAELNGRSCGLLRTYYLVDCNFHFGTHKTSFFSTGYTVTPCQIAFWPPKRGVQVVTTIGPGSLLDRFIYPKPKPLHVSHVNPTGVICRVSGEIW